MKLVSGWCEWLVKRPQGQRHNDLMNAGVASALCASQGMRLPPEHFMFYERRPVEVLSQVAIDASVEKLKAHAKRQQKPPEQKGGLDG